MPFRHRQSPPDLERAARVLDAGGVRGDAAPAGVGALAAPDGRGSPEPQGEHAGGWVPEPPDGARPGASHLRSAVRRLTEHATDDEVSRIDADLRRARRPGVLTVPDELLSGRRGFSSAAVVSMLALVVAVGCAFLLRVLWAERSASASERPEGTRSVQVAGGTATAATVPAAGGRQPLSSASASSISVGGSSGSAPPGGAGGGAASAGSVVVVHVVGQVNRPGLVQLRQGARVADAITAAGGALRGADLSVLNLARLVQDGEQIRVPKPGESPVPPGAAASGARDGTGPRSGSGGSGGPVSLNTADAAALDSLPGVGPVLAQRIVDWRTEHGRFTSVDELGEVSGIGDKLMAQLRPKVTL